MEIVPRQALILNKEAQQGHLVSQVLENYVSGIKERSSIQIPLS